MLIEQFNDIEQIEQIQKEIDRRTAVENQAIQLISECQFEKAMELLNTI